ncbi:MULTISPECIES: DUF2621 family protein [Oceanobacillus]|nr:MULTISPECIES: DUF2621 family protein [Oceanobacillus]
MSIILVLWGFLLISLMGIGGFFMFRKFLKSLPKEDGKSVLDWQEHYVDLTKEMWRDEEKALLDELVSPVPELFRDVARQTIASKIGEVALKKKEEVITQDTLIEGYIIATPKRDHKFLRKKLKEKGIPVEPYEHLFQLSKNDYRTNWQESYKK